MRSSVLTHCISPNSTKIKLKIINIHHNLFSSRTEERLRELHTYFRSFRSSVVSKSFGNKIRFQRHSPDPLCHWWVLHVTSRLQWPGQIKVTPSTRAETESRERKKTQELLAVRVVSSEAPGSVQRSDLMWPKQKMRFADFTYVEILWTMLLFSIFSR